MSAMMRWCALAIVVALGLALLQVAGVPTQAQSSDRAKRLGGKLMCMCGCAQVLTACNHVGCTVSAAMLKEMDERVTRNDPDDLILQSFVQEYGEKVLAEPPNKGFNRLAWYIPGIAFVLGLGLVAVVLSHWRRREAVTPAGSPEVPAELLERARRQADRETEE